MRMKDFNNNLPLSGSNNFMKGSTELNRSFFFKSFIVSNPNISRPFLNC